MPEPTQQDIANAQLRQAIADRQRAEYALAESYAVSLFGAGWEPSGRHMLVSHAEAHAARTENRPMKPAATVYTASKGNDRRHFVVENGHAREVASYAEGFGPMLLEEDPATAFTWKGETRHLHRYGLYWAGYESGYTPRTAEQLAAARERREQKAVEKEAEGSLFADLIRAEGYVTPKRKGLGR